MPFNGTGTFSRVMNWVSDAANSINITASRMDTDTQDIANGLSNCITRDGQGKPSAAIDWNAQTLSNVSAYSGNSTFSGGKVKFTASSTTGADVASTYSLGAASNYDFVDSTRTANNRVVEWLWTGGSFVGRFLKDDYTAAANWMIVTGGQAAGIASIDFAQDLRVAPVVGSTRYIQVAGSVAGNPTITASGGSIALGSAVTASALITASAGINTAAADNTGLGIGISRSKAAATARSTTTTLADDPDLIVPLSVGRWRYKIFIGLWATTGGAGGFRFATAFSGTATTWYAGAYQAINAAATTASSLANAGAGNSFATISTNTGPIDYLVIEGTIVVSVAGNLSFQWAQNSSSANAANVGIGSSMEVFKVG